MKNREIERKFLVADLDELKAEIWAKGVAAKKIKQGYFGNQDPLVRVRVTDNQRTNLVIGTVTVKASIPGSVVTREEIEVNIPASSAESMLALCPFYLEKDRYSFDAWDVDYIPCVDLWLAEIELDDEGAAFDKPIWVGEEVTADRAYNNLSIADSEPALLRYRSDWIEAVLKERR